MEAFIIGWCVKNVGESPSPVAFDLESERNLLVSVLVLSVSTYTKTSECRGNRFQRHARERCSFILPFSVAGWGRASDAAPCTST